MRGSIDMNATREDEKGGGERPRGGWRPAMTTAIAAPLGRHPPGPDACCFKKSRVQRHRHGCPTGLALDRLLIRSFLRHACSTSANYAFSAPMTIRQTQPHDMMMALSFTTDPAECSPSAYPLLTTRLVVINHSSHRRSCWSKRRRRTTASK